MNTTNPIFDAPVTIYSTVQDRTGRKGTLGDFLLMGREHRNLIDRIRTTKDTEQRRKLKATLPAATLSGVFCPTRSKENLVLHNGLMCIDIDHVQDQSKLLHDLNKIGHVAYAARSVSGKGVFAIVPIKYPSKHERQYKQFITDLRNTEGILQPGMEFDEACKDVTRLRFASYDDEVVYYPEAVPYEGIYTEPVCLPQQYSYQERNYDDPDADTATTEFCVDYCISQLEARNIDITHPYSQWIDIGFALVSEFGESGRCYWHRISALSNCGDYRPAKADKVYTELLKADSRSITVKTLFAYCRAAGIDYGEAQSTFLRERRSRKREQAHEKAKDIMISSFLTGEDPSEWLTGGEPPPVEPHHADVDPEPAQTDPERIYYHLMPEPPASSWPEGWQPMWEQPPFGTEEYSLWADEAAYRIYHKIHLIN